MTFNGIAAGDISGQFVSNAGDINGDGIADLLIGARTADPNGNSAAGQNYLVYGRSGASALSGTFDLATADVTFNGIAVGDESGISVSNAGDINGDGIDDLLIGARGVNGGSGATYLVYGKSGASALSGAFDLATADVTFNGIGGGDDSGSFVSNAGDINGDGIDDLLIGADRASPTGLATAGQSYLVYGKSGASALSGAFSLANADVTFNGIGVNDQSGFSVSNAGDINGDGINDLLIGAANASPNGLIEAGQAYLVYGKSGASALSGAFDLATADVTFNGIVAGDGAGWSVSNAGDVNGDGVDDFLIGAAIADPNGLANAGQTYLVFGQAETVPEPGTIFLVGLGLLGIARGVRRRQAGAEKAKK